MKVINTNYLHTQNIKLVSLYMHDYFWFLQNIQLCDIRLSHYIVHTHITPEA